MIVHNASRGCKPVPQRMKNVRETKVRTFRRLLCTCSMGKGERYNSKRTNEPFDTGDCFATVVQEELI